MLSIKNLHASVAGKEIIKGFNLEVKAGEVHAIMGPNGSGKSTLSNVLAGREDYEVISGEVKFRGKNLLELSPEDRAREGLFLAFQYPVEVPGITNRSFLRTSFNAICKHHGVEEMSESAFETFLQKKMQVVEMEERFMDRSVNAGFSGGEKKRNEILQMSCAV